VQHAQQQRQQLPARLLGVRRRLGQQRHLLGRQQPHAVLVVVQQQPQLLQHLRARRRAARDAVAAGQQLAGGDARARP
jgi:hypothetical protein